MQNSAEWPNDRRNRKLRVPRRRRAKVSIKYYHHLQNLKQVNWFSMTATNIFILPLHNLYLLHLSLVTQITDLTFRKHTAMATSLCFANIWKINNWSFSHCVISCSQVKHSWTNHWRWPLAFRLPFPIKVGKGLFPTSSSLSFSLKKIAISYGQMISKATNYAPKLFWIG